MQCTIRSEKQVLTVYYDMISCLSLFLSLSLSLPLSLFLSLLFFYLSHSISHLPFFSLSFSLSPSFLLTLFLSLSLLPSLSLSLSIIFLFSGVFVGNDARYCCYDHPDAGLRGGLLLKAVLEHGHIAHKTGFLLLIQHCLFRGLGIDDLSNVQLLFSFKLSFSSNDIRYLGECLFELLQCDIVCLMSEASLVGNAYRLLAQPQNTGFLGSFNGEIPHDYMGTFYGDTPPGVSARGSFSGTLPQSVPVPLAAPSTSTSTSTSPLPSLPQPGVINTDWIANGGQTGQTVGGIVAVGVEGGVIQKIREIEKMERLEKAERIARNERERLEKMEKLEKQKLEKQKEKMEKLEKFEKDKLERIEKEKVERERLEKERIENEKLEKEKLDKIEREKKEKIEKEKKENKENKEKRNLGSFTAELKALSLELYEPSNNVLVVDIGCRCITVSPIYEGIVMKNNIEKCNVGGEHVTDFMELLLAAQNNDIFSSLLPRRKRLISRVIKEQYCYISSSFSDNISAYGGFRFDKIKLIKNNNARHSSMVNNNNTNINNYNNNNNSNNNSNINNSNNNNNNNNNNDSNNNNDHNKERSLSFPNSSGNSNINTPRDYTQSLTPIKNPGSLSIKVKTENKLILKNLARQSSDLVLNLDDYEDDEDENINININEKKNDSDNDDKQNKNLFPKKIQPLNSNSNKNNKNNNNGYFSFNDHERTVVSVPSANEEKLLSIRKEYNCTLPSGTHVTLKVDKERFHCCEVLFDPHVFQGEEYYYYYYRCYYYCCYYYYYYYYYYYHCYH